MRNNWIVKNATFGFIPVEIPKNQPPIFSIGNSQAHSGLSSLRLSVGYSLPNRAGPEFECPGQVNLPTNFSLTFNSEIVLPSGFYEVGGWVMEKSSADHLPPYSVDFLADILTGTPDVLSLGFTYPNNIPSSWKRFSKIIQVPEEVGQGVIKPQFRVAIVPQYLPCDFRMDVWVDDVFLVPVQPPDGVEVHVLQPPEEFFWEKLEEKTTPLFNKAQPLFSNMDQGTARRLNDGLVGSPDVGNVTKNKKFLYLLDAVSGLVKEYDIKKDTSQVGAQEFLDLAQNICQLLRENFPEEYENKKQQEPNSACAILE